MNDEKIIFDKNRRLIIYGGEIDSEFALRFTDYFTQLAADNRSINLICTGSVGGDWDGAGLGLMDLISSCKCHITMFGQGMQASSQALLFCSADERVIAPNGYLMFHDGSIEVSTDQAAFERLAEVTKILCDDTHKFLSEVSKKPIKFFKEKMVKDWYVFADEALEIGLATKVGTIYNIE